MLAAGVYSHAGHEGASSIYASEGMTAAPTRDSMRREEEERQGLLLRGGEQRQIARDAYPEIVRGQPARPGDWPERPLCCCCCCSTGAGHAGMETRASGGRRLHRPRWSRAWEESVAYRETSKLW